MTRSARISSSILCFIFALIIAALDTGLWFQIVDLFKFAEDSNTMQIAITPILLVLTILAVGGIFSAVACIFCGVGLLANKSDEEVVESG